MVAMQAIIEPAVDHEPEAWLIGKADAPVACPGGGREWLELKSPGVRAGAGRWGADARELAGGGRESSWR